MNIYPERLYRNSYKNVFSCGIDTPKRVTYWLLIFIYFTVFFFAISKKLRYLTYYVCVFSSVTKHRASYIHTYFFYCFTFCNKHSLEWVLSIELYTNSQFYAQFHSKNSKKCIFFFNFYWNDIICVGKKKIL